VVVVRMTRAAATVLVSVIVVAMCNLPSVAQTSTRDLEVLQRSGRLAGDKRECTRQCRPLYKECLPNCERNGQVPGVTTRSENCREDCSTLVSQCMEECAKRLSGFSVLIRPCR
jgi:hypothetical protein